MHDDASDPAAWDPCHMTIAVRNNHRNTDAGVGRRMPHAPACYLSRSKTKPLLRSLLMRVGSAYRVWVFVRCIRIGSPALTGAVNASP